MVGGLSPEAESHPERLVCCHGGWTNGTEGVGGAACDGWWQTLRVSRRVRVTNEAGSLTSPFDESTSRRMSVILIT